MTANINIQTPMDNYQINNYAMPNNNSQNVYRPGVVFRKEHVKEDAQNNALFRYAIPKIDSAQCLNVGMRPQETRHDLLGVNMCDVLRNDYANDNIIQREKAKFNQPSIREHCSIEPYVPSWVKYSSSINTESDMKNIMRKKSCDVNSVYIPSTNSVMYSKAPMPRDNTINSGYYAVHNQEDRNGTIPNFFMEDTRQTRMGKLN